LYFRRDVFCPHAFLRARSHSADQPDLRATFAPKRIYSQPCVRSTTPCEVICVVEAKNPLVLSGPAYAHSAHRTSSKHRSSNTALPEVSAPANAILSNLSGVRTAGVAAFLLGTSMELPARSLGYSFRSIGWRCSH
jgi:hypothetical protein